MQKEVLSASVALLCVCCSSCGLRIKNAVLWTLAMAVVLGLAIGCAYGKWTTSSSAGAQPHHTQQPQHMARACIKLPAAQPVFVCITGLAGYVEYPTQELVSGLYPLSEVPNMAALTTKCIKPGQGLYNSTSTVRDSMVSVCADSSRFLPCSNVLAAAAQLIR
jgi:hypothetical protein